MQWDSSLFRGQHGDWHWGVCRQNVRGLPRFVTNACEGHRLGIATFDCGSILPTAEELDLGWHVIDGVMFSPPLTSEIVIPCDVDDEWYVFDQLPTALPQLERFVGIGAFNLADPRQMEKSFDPTWERSGLDWLYPVQERFWTQMDAVQPVAYVASGDTDVVVCLEPCIIDEFLKMAGKQVADS